MNNKKLTVWVLQTGEPLHVDSGDPRPMRAMNLANTLVSSGHNVVLWSSAFNHQERKHRTNSVEFISISEQLELRLIPSPGYSRNIGPGRIWDHLVLGYRLKKLLKGENKLPDVAFVGYPPIEVASVMTKWLFNHKVPHVLDIKDQWPSIFILALPSVLQPIGKLMFAPYFYLAKRSMHCATALTAMSQSFLEWAYNFSNKSRSEFDRVVPLTAPVSHVNSQKYKEAQDWWDQQGMRSNGKSRFIFVGSLSQAFDFDTIIEAAKKLVLINPNCEFIICGTGEQHSYIKDRIQDINNIFLPGWINRAQMQVLVERSLATIAPYKNTDNFTMNIPNKIIDSLLFGLPILTPLQGEILKLIDDEGIGLTYNSSDSLVAQVIKLSEDNQLANELSKNSLDTYNKQFSFDKVYGGFVEHLVELSEK